METLTCLPPQGRKAGQALQLAEPPLDVLELLHHLSELRVLLEQPVDVLHRRPAAARDALTPRAIDDLRALSLVRSHGQDDRVEPVEVRLLAVEVLGRRLQGLAER